MLGPIPPSLYDQIIFPGMRQFFDAWVYGRPLRESSLERQERVLGRMGRREEKEMFVNFMKRCLRWDPKERATAGELLEDPFLAGSLGTLTSGSGDH